MEKNQNVSELLTDSDDFFLSEFAFPGYLTERLAADILSENAGVLLIPVLFDKVRDPGMVNISDCGFLRIRLLVCIFKTFRDRHITAVFFTAKEGFPPCPACQTLHLVVLRKESLGISVL